jgi:hypothetical protein
MAQGHQKSFGLREIKMKIFLIIIVLFTSAISQAGEFDALLGYSFADKFERENADIHSEGAFNLGVRYKDTLEKGFGWNVGLGLENLRDLKETDSRLAFSLLESNVTWAITQIDSLYIYGGLNVPIEMYQEKGGISPKPALGVQFGSGWNFTPKFGVELGFRTVNFEFAGVDSNLWGFAVRGFYTFAAF